MTEKGEEAGEVSPRVLHSVDYTPTALCVCVCVGGGGGGRGVVYAKVSKPEADVCSEVGTVGGGWGGSGRGGGGG